MARFSVVVPSMGNISRFEETLASVLRYRPDNMQVIVVHAGDYEDRYGLGKEVDFIPAGTHHQPNLIELFNAGVREARGQWVGLLRPGIQLTENWEQGVESAFSSTEVASVSPLIVTAENAQRVVVAGVRAGAGFTRELQNEPPRQTNPVQASRSGTRLLGPTSWAAFYRRSFLVALDECDSTLGDNYFDLDLALSFASLGFQNISQAGCRLTCTAEALQEIQAEAAQAHGCSAQRAQLRFGDSIEVAPALSSSSAWMRDLLSWPWSWQNLTHARQRQQANRFKLADQHYRGLLNLLREQRTRLVSPGLHARVAAHRSHSTTQRRAA